MNGATGSPISIGRIDFDPVSGDLTGPDGRARLAPQPAALFSLLVERSGEVVSRKAIRAHLWPGGKVDYEQGIAFAVREVRKAIEAVGGDPGLVETLPKRGLRVSAAPRSRSVPARRIAIFAVAVTAVAAAALLVLTTDRGRTPVVALFAHAAPTGGATALVADRLGSSLTSSLTSALSREAGLIGPTGTATVGGPEESGSIRDALGACLAVSGSVTPLSDDLIAIFTQVVRTSDRVHVWARVDTIPMSASLEPTVAHVIEGVRQGLNGC